MSDLNAMPDEKPEGLADGQQSAPPENTEQPGASQEESAAPATEVVQEAAVGTESTTPVEQPAVDDAGNAGVSSDSAASEGVADAGNAVDASASSASDAGSLPLSSGEATAPDVAPVADVVRTPDAQMPSHPVYPAPAQPAPTTSPTPALAAQAADPTLAAIASATTIVNSAPTTDLSQKTADAESDPHEQMLVIMRNSLEQVARDTGDFHAAQAFVHLVQIDAAALHGAVQGSIAQFFASRGVDLGTASDAQ